MIPSRKARALAWALGLTGAPACAFTLGLTVALGLFSLQALVLLIFIMTALLGALVASRKPDNSVGWLMCASSLAATLLFLPMDYGYIALVVERGSWPLGGIALWLNAWDWAPLLGMFLPLLAVRFPDGKVTSQWRIVDWLATAGTAALIVSVALASADVLRRFLPLSQTQAAGLLLPLVQNPLGTSLPAGLLGQVRIVGLAVIVLGYVSSAASLVARFRRARGDERLQLKWVAYSGVLIAVAAVYAAVAWIFLGWAPGDALLPLDFAVFSLPLAIGIAILRYRLYDIDLIINRTLVYGGMTAILAAAYTAGVQLFQRLFVSESGQKSDAAYVLTAFVVVVGFSPLKDWLQHQVDRRLGGSNPTRALDQFSSRVDAVVSVLDVDRIACGLLDEAVSAFNVRGGALYLQSGTSASPTYSLGDLNGEGVIEVALRHEGRQFGRLVLGSRRGGVAYTVQDRDALQRSADSVGEALALAEHLGLRPLPNSRTEKETSA